MKTGILAAFALALAACSGQVVTQSPTSGSTVGALGGLQYCGLCPIKPPCPPPPNKCDVSVTHYTVSYQDSSMLSPEEQKVEAQMEYELASDLYNKAAADEAAQQSLHR
jgi:hypothetical protein